MTKAKGYTVSKWNDLDNFECTSCPYATLHYDKIRAHVTAHKLGAVGVEGVEEYEIVKKKGGYYQVFAPDGSLVEGPSNGKWQGHDGAVQGARIHAVLEAASNEEE